MRELSLVGDSYRIAPVYYSMVMRSSVCYTSQQNESEIFARGYTVDVLKL